MIKKIISTFLLLITVGLHFKHGWEAFTNPTKQQLNLVAKLGLEQAAIPYIGAGVIILGLLLMAPKTYVLGNIMNAIVILMIISFAFNDENYTLILFEIPFLIIPFLMIWLKHPLSKTNQKQSASLEAKINY